MFSKLLYQKLLWCFFFILQSVGHMYNLFQKFIIDFAFMDHQGRKEIPGLLKTQISNLDVHVLTKPTILFLFCFYFVYYV